MNTAEARSQSVMNGFNVSRPSIGQFNINEHVKINSSDLEKVNKIR